VLSFGMKPDGDAIRVTLLTLGVSDPADADAVDDVLATRCSGPRLDDLGALPSAQTSLDALRSRDGVTLRFAGEHAFAGGGFAGTVRWTARLRLQRAE
jgi:hypothetical protein